MKKRIASSIIFVLFAFGLLMSVSAGGQQEGAGSGEAEEATAELAKDIEFWECDTRESWDNALKALVADYKEEKGVTVNLTIVPWTDLGRRVATAKVSGTLPDMMYSFGSHYTSWYYQEASQSVDDIIKAVGEDQWSDSLRDAVTMDGKYVAIPIYTYPHVLFYRKDLYEKHGLSEPKTWDEFLANIKALHDPDNKFYGMLLFSVPGDPVTILNIMAVNNAYVFDKDGNVAIDRPETVEALEFLKELQKYNAPGLWGSTQQEEIRHMFLANLGAHMATSVSFSYPLITQEKDRIDDFGAFHWPTNKGDKRGVSPLASLAVSATTEKRETVKDFILYWLEQDRFTQFGTQMVQGHIPALNFVLNSDDYWESERIAPIAHFLKAGMQVSDKGVQEGMTFGPNPWAGRLTAEHFYSEMTDKVIVRDEDPEEVVKWAEQRVKEIIE